MRRQAFTLIELLIVVAIIAILAAIAVPNFLEAQMRSKIARAKADMRTATTGLETYCIDYNTYPTPSKNFLNIEDWVMDDFGKNTPELTTPTAYLGSMPKDPFGYAKSWGPGNYSQFEKQRVNYKYHYFYLVEFTNADGELVSSWANAAGFSEESQRKGYILYTFGPDQAQDGLEWVAFTGSGVDAVYDPTNGTISSGDIGRVGGDVSPNSASVLNQ